MIRIIVILIVQGTFLQDAFLHASFMDSIGDVVKSTLSDNDDNKMPEIQTVGTVQTVGKRRDNHKKNSLLDGILDDVKDTLSGDKKIFSKDSFKDNLMDGSIIGVMVDSAKKTIGIKEEKKKKKSSFLKDTVTAMKEVTGLKTIKQDNSLFDGGIMGEMADMIDLEKGETWGLPSVFGLNKKKQKKVFGSTILAGTILGDTKDATTGFYRGFKRTGESTEFMSGVMYKSSKMYNGMFEIFDDSPLNIFDDKDEREPSVFDVFDKGNDVLDIFK